MAIIPSNDSQPGRRAEQQDKFYINDVTKRTVLMNEGLWLLLLMAWGE